MSWGLVYNKSWLCHKHWSWLYAQGKHSENIQSTLKVKVKVAQSCPTLWPHGLYNWWNSPGQNTGVGGLSLLQGIFPTQESNWRLLHCRQILCQLRWGIKEVPIHFTEHQKRKYLWIVKFSAISHICHQMTAVASKKDSLPLVKCFLHLKHQ